MFKPIKSPVGETVSDDSYRNGLTYMDEDVAQSLYCIWQMLLGPIPPFADWLEAQGVRLL